MIAARLREAREFMCLAPVEAATAAGIDSVDLTMLECGERPPNDLELQRLARVYGYTTSFFTAASVGADADRAIARLDGPLTHHDREEARRLAAYLRYAADD